MKPTLTALGGALLLALSACAPVTDLWPHRGDTVAVSLSAAGAEDLIRSRFEDPDWEGTGGSRPARLAWMTPALAEASLRLDAMTGGYGVGMEPSMGSPYIYATEARYQTRQTPYGAEVTVRFLNTNEPRETRFEMVMTEAGWRVADIVGTDVASGRTWRYTEQMAEVFAAITRGEQVDDPS
jgi:hypothetical protein